MLYHIYNKTVQIIKMEINDLEIEIEHKAIKNVHLSVYPPTGRVKVSAPLLYPDEKIKLYLLQKWLWIVEKRDRCQQYEVQPEREYISGEAHYYKGQLFRLKVNQVSKGHQSVEINGDYIVLNVIDPTNVKQKRDLLNRWYKTQLEPVLESYVQKWEARLNVTLESWTIKNMKARWGSCDTVNQKALFNLQLAKKPENCIEYVVVHELVHLLERNHTARFKTLLSIYLPNWKEIKKELNEFPI